VLARFDWLTLLRVGLRTGRTHQVRVHLASLGHPVFADALYGGVDFVTRLAPSDRPSAHRWLGMVGRVALHAYRLAFRHPADGERLVFEAPVPPDIESVLLELGERGGRS
jgi:23S rRNA pseudouridine1911/1915/1917 synthase